MDDEGFEDYAELLSYLRTQYDDLDGVPLPKLLHAAAALCMRRHLEAAERLGRTSGTPDETVEIPLWLLEGLAGYLLQADEHGDPPVHRQKHLGEHHDRWIAVIYEHHVNGHTVDDACYVVGQRMEFSTENIWKSYKLVERLRRQR